MSNEGSRFVKGEAVWPRELSGVINGLAGFRAVFAARKGEKALLRVAGASIYRVWMNGRFLAHGPARAAHGFARVDEIPLDARLKTGRNAWHRDPDAPAGAAICERRSGVQLLPRAVAFPRYGIRRPTGIVSRGKLVPHTPEKLWKDRALVKIGPQYKGYPEEELAFVLSTELQQFASCRAKGKGNTRVVGALGAGEYATLDFGPNGTGFIGLQVSCAEPTRLVPVFDEMLSSGDVDFKRLSCTAAMSYELAPGTYRLESLEPYVFRYLKLQVFSGRCRVDAVYQRELVNAEADGAQFACDDPGLNAIFAAGVDTFRQNVVDIYMDCPSRERAGWLCDSFFMGRVEQDLCGHSRVERNFLENFLLPPSFANLPNGMVPMCYPAEHPNGTFIPNWALWRKLLLEFGPRRKRKDLHPDIPPANAFIGSYLRMELLSRCGAAPQLLREMKNFLLPMARLTGTLWENLDTSASCNHGFASHACHVLLRDALGVAEIDTQQRKIRLSLARTALRRCEGRIPVPGGFLAVRWQKRGKTIQLRVRAPAGFDVQVENHSGLNLKRVL